MEIRTALESRRDGIRTLEQSLAEVVGQGQVTYETAAGPANDFKALDRLLSAVTATCYR